MHIEKKIKLKKMSPAMIIKIEIIFVLAERFLVQVLKLPTSIIYIVDILNLWLFVCLLYSKKWKRFIGLVLPYVGIVILSLLIGIISFNKWGGNFASALVEIRNIVRFPVFFLACVSFLNNKHVREIYKILTVFFGINTIAIIYQYFTFHPSGIWMRGDMLNGLFGTETGGNTFVNVILLVIVTYLLSCWMNKEKSALFFGIVTGISLLISALIELKAFFIEIIIIYGFYLGKKEKSKKVIFINIFFIFAAIMISRFGLLIMYQEYPWFKGSMSISGIIQQLLGNGYTGDGDLNRFTGIFAIASRIFHGDIADILLGIGAGNASQSVVLGSQTLFFDKYSATHYNWFSATYMFVQGGAVGLLTYLYTFGYLFFKKKQNLQLKMNSQIMCVMAVFLVFYGEALRTDAGYFMYFAIASGFIKVKKKEQIEVQKSKVEKVL